MRTTLIPPGHPAPWFHARTRGNPDYAFESVAGRYVVLGFYGTASNPWMAEYLQHIAAMPEFDDLHACFFGVSNDPADVLDGRIADRIPGIRHFHDFDAKVSALYGAVQSDGRAHAASYLLDPSLRVIAAVPMAGTPEAHVAALRAQLAGQPPIEPLFTARAQAPVLVLPRIFEPALCEALIEYYDKAGGHPSGFMREVEGITTEVRDPQHKRRRDCDVEDETLRNACMVRIHDRLGPELRKAFHFSPTRMERYIVSCYDAREAGHFRAHRDNTTRGTAHRRFAVSLFLNAGFEGGRLRFPEYGSALYHAPVGGAVVFSCSMLHEAMPVTAGRRYMFLPFLYDEEARGIRERNRAFLDVANGGDARRDGAPASSGADFAQPARE